MKIAVHGASGFTGGLVVAELARRGVEAVLVGRSRERLRAVADAEVRVATLDDPDALAAAFAGCAAVVNTAGPFTRWGGPVLRAALAARVHYVDTSGEQGQIHDVLATAGPDAERAGVTVVPALADDGGPGDLIAALTAARVAPAREILVADLRLPGGASRGTARSMASIVGRGPLEYADGGWRPDTGGHAPVDLPGERVEVAPFPLPGVATVPRHVPAARVRAAMRADVVKLFASFDPGAAELAPAVLDEATRRAGRWCMLARATGSGATATGVVTGPDPYGLTAVIAVEGALRLARGDARPGALTPAQAFEPAGFLDALVPHGVAWRVE
ncbi:saccharopine dehydrogenase family protein [Actinomadura rayongensis]|uniref:NAD(P)H-binding protein n=1 Tax=Actinomadura rayongensis TaxID=1429076 RepID=A0A6I4WAB2_9ACTN|nr:saccharopine dehydrogenase NADP-binding domain-containing protein [Actinomadura rayongensis]MXQ66521.1 NAD(P)H-binding protein [Actinomadura rayongensis]